MQETKTMPHSEKYTILLDKIKSQMYLSRPS